MAHMPCLISAALFFTLSFCGGGSGTLIEKKVGDTVEIPTGSSSNDITNGYWIYGDKYAVKIVEDFDVKESRFKGRVKMKDTTFDLIISELTLQDSGKFQFVSSANDTQRKTISFTLRVYEAITNVKVRKISSTWSSDTCAVWLECAASPSHSDKNWTWTIRNETHTGATLKYVPKEVEEVICTISNPVSNDSASMWVGCNNNTGSGAIPTGVSTGPPPDLVPQFWVFILTGLGAGMLFLVLVLVFICCLKRRKAAAEAMETYETIDIRTTNNTTTDDETLGSIYATVKDKCVRPSPQKNDSATIYYTVQPSS